MSSLSPSSPIHLNSNPSSEPNLQDSPSLSKRRKDMFGDCALVEIIHLHDCLRGALRALERDVEELNRTLLLGNEKDDSETTGTSTCRSQRVNELECRVNGRFKVIWSVFRAHSSAEDEFIWPALQLKTKGLIKGSPTYRPDQNHPHHTSPPPNTSSCSSQQQLQSSCPSSRTCTVSNPTRSRTPPRTNRTVVVVVEDDTQIDQEAYEEDHADEERMFSTMDDLLTQLREGLFLQTSSTTTTNTSHSTNEQVAAPLQASSTNVSSIKKAVRSVDDIMKSVHEMTQTLSQHLMTHLEKEEKQCMPLVVKHLSKSEIHELVGQIMGKRSSDMISKIMTMAVHNLNQADRLEMVKYMKQAMAGTFFDKWLSMSGWMEDVKTDDGGELEAKSENADTEDRKRSGSSNHPEDEGDPSSINTAAPKRTKLGFPPSAPNLSIATSDSTGNHPSTVAPTATAHVLNDITSQAELEKLIRVIANNPTLTPQQKNTTIQGLRDSVWKSNQRHKEHHSSALPTATLVARAYASADTGSAAASATCVPARRVTPPAMYYKKNANAKLEVAFDADKPTQKADGQIIPLFSASELAPSYHDGATGAVLGCPHYARACKLRHPVSGRLYTCRLCCEQEREMPSKDQDEPLDRYAVTEVMCMKCNTLQPADDRCINPNCESDGKPFAKYFCNICHLYDDRPRPIFHCPYCNTCRMGLGLGIDFRHCMRCNACVSLEDHEHRCIPQKLQGSCPICHESLFQSTQPLRGLKCGHVMHMSCFTDYRRGQRYKCPLCMKSMEDMTDYFALLDAAVRMQPMPMAYLATISNVYCQDCEKTGQCRYHFVGQKCPSCGSYNTRELGRVQSTDYNLS